MRHKAWLGFSRVVTFTVVLGATLTACSSDGDGDGDSGANGDGDGGDNPFGNPELDGAVLDGGGDAGIVLSPLEIEPANPVLMVTAAEPNPEIQLGVRRDGRELSASRWTVLEPDVGTIDEDGLFVASGNVARETRVEAFVGEERAGTTITVQVEREDNGAEDDGSGTSSGGYGGVGGEGPGGPVDDALRDVLLAAPTDDDSLQWLYPYDNTVFPLGLLAPLMQWSESEHGTVDGIYLKIQSTHFDYQGFFGRPPALAADAAFVRHPIPQDVWESATRSARGSSLDIELVVAIDGKAYGPITREWRIANGELKGTVYYQSYGTDLAKNYEGAVGGDGRFGGATLAIRPGDRGPTLVAGGDGGHDQCRVCHSVASQGARMVVQHGDNYGMSSSYDLLNGNMESAYPDPTSTLLSWIGMSPDGELGLGNATPLGLDFLGTSTQLYDMNDGSQITTTGLSDFVTLAGFPAFSSVGDRVAFNFFSGPGNAAIGMGDTKKLVMMTFDRASMAFSDPTLLYEGELSPGWPSFTPDQSSVIFARQIQQGDRFFHTRSGGKGELWWSNLLTGESYPLTTLNGEDYLPQGENNHMADHELAYEPTVAPIASGGYAWVVFMSRRQYGNVATIDPWRSDPREYDHTAEITPKKLWVAAIDLNIPRDLDGMAIMSDLGEDPSHPAFYLPGQELHAGNTRGFWVVDPCKADGMSCESGVECCTGRCQEDFDTGERTCGLKNPGCAEEFDRCEKSADCCDRALICLGNICTQATPPE